jgi:hypothetical protein
LPWHPAKLRRERLGVFHGFNAFIIFSGLRQNEAKETVRAPRLGDHFIGSVVQDGIRDVAPVHGIQAIGILDTTHGFLVTAALLNNHRLAFNSVTALAGQQQSVSAFDMAATQLLGRGTHGRYKPK